MKPPRPLEELLRIINEEETNEWVELTPRELRDIAHHTGVSMADSYTGLPPFWSSPPGHPAEVWGFSSRAAFFSWVRKHGFRIDT